MGAERGRASPGQPYCSACSVEMELAMIIPPFRTYGLKISTPVQSAGVRKTTWLSRLRRRRDCPGGFGGDDEPSGRISET